MFITKNKKTKKQKGFTLVEMLVSVALFSIIMVIAIGALFAILNLNRKSQSIKNLSGNLNLAMEAMSRELRVGHTYNCDADFGNMGKKDCPSGGDSVSFITADGCVAWYGFENGKIKRRIDKPVSSALCKGRNSSDGRKINIVGDEVSIDDFKFYVFGSADLNSTVNIQPRILMTVKGSYGQEEDAASFNLQTTVSQRKIDG